MSRSRRGFWMDGERAARAGPSRVARPWFPRRTAPPSARAACAGGGPARMGCALVASRGGSVAALAAPLLRTGY